MAADLTVRPPQPGSFAPAPIPLRDHSGHDGGDAHMGPMWIVMGVMMVGMMVALGAYMMRNGAVSNLEPGAGASPHLAAVPPRAGFRPGG